MCVLDSVYLGRLTRKLHCSKLDILHLGDLLGFFMAEVGVWQCRLSKIFKLKLLGLGFMVSNFEAIHPFFLEYF